MGKHGKVKKKKAKKYDTLAAKARAHVEKRRKKRRTPDQLHAGVPRLSQRLNFWGT